MVTYDLFASELVSKGIDKAIVNKLIEEYGIVKHEYLNGDDEKVVLHSAKFSDLTLALIKNKETGQPVDINEIHFDEMFKEILNYPKATPEQTILTLAIPRVAVSIQTIRNKKNVAHTKTIDPCFIDSYYCLSSCDWILSELAMLFYTSNPKEAKKLVDTFLRKKVPLVEEFEDKSVVILTDNMTLFEETLLTLYHFYPERLTNSFLLPLLKSKNLYSVLDNAEIRKLIHRNAEGSKLTLLGIQYVEKLLTKLT